MCMRASKSCWKILILNNMEWQSIDNPPEKGTAVVAAYMEAGRLRYREVARFEAGRWMLNNEDELTFFTPTHWLPLSQYRPSWNCPD